jgi:large subunit ribosomal protein L1
MTKKSKRVQTYEKKLDLSKSYNLSDALEILKNCAPVKFDQSIEISMKMGVDPRKSDQQVRGTVSLPNGTGKKIKILVFAKGDKANDALEAGADFIGDDETLEKLKGGWTGFDAVVATPDMMREVGKLGKILGPRGLMPSPKAGTVTVDVKKAVEELKAGKVEFKVDKNSVINNLVGKLSFSLDKIMENIQKFLQAINRAKPSSSKGVYIRSLYLSSTMGPGLKIDVNSII